MQRLLVFGVAMGPSAIAGWVAMALQRTSPGDPRNCQGEGANNSLALLNWLVVLTIFKNISQWEG